MVGHCAVRLTGASGDCALVALARRSGRRGERWHVPRCRRAGVYAGAARANDISRCPARREAGRQRIEPACGFGVGRRRNSRCSRRGESGASSKIFVRSDAGPVPPPRPRLGHCRRRSTGEIGDVVGLTAWSAPVQLDQLSRPAGTTSTRAAADQSLAAEKIVVGSSGCLRATVEFRLWPIFGGVALRVRVGLYCSVSGSCNGLRAAGPPPALGRRGCERDDIV